MNPGVSAGTAVPQAPIHQGLTSEQAAKALAQSGPNQLPQDHPASWWQLLIRQFASPLVYIILGAAGISLALREYSDFGIIMAVVVVDVALGFVQERRAQSTYLALKSLVRPQATVIRDGQRIDVDVTQLVPGDVVVLAAGDKVPADGVLIETTRLAADEAVLTGESEPVTKSTTTNVDTADRDSRAFMGTTIVTGHGLMLIDRTGSATELGSIASSLDGNAEEATPLQVRLSAFSRVLTRVVVASCVLILAVGAFMGRDFVEMLRIAIMLSIAAVPEGLVIAVTVILVSGMRRILARRGLVKRLLAVETLGSVTVICTDKTGTLTEGRMRVIETELPDQEQALRTMALCNNLEGPVDIALWEYCEAQSKGDAQSLVAGVQRIAEEPFSSESKYMVVVVGGQGNTAQTLYLKGAPEVVLAMCDVSGLERERITEVIDQWSGRGLRLIGLAHRSDGALDKRSGYTWAGLVGMQDAIRAAVPTAIATAQRAGIRVVMLTGDYRRTAQSIATSAGLGNEPSVLEGTEVAAMSEEALKEAVRTTDVFARVRPHDKLRIVQALTANGEVTAMIGDGVNDAPALTHAHIGVVVGSATDVAKETADLILLDNDFSTVVSAIEEGRVIFDNIRKVVAYVLSNSFAEVLTILVAMLIGWPVPLLVAQILWIHLICDGPGDIVLGFEPKEAGVMQRRPHSLREPILDRLGAALIVTISLSSAAFGLTMFGHHYLVRHDAVAGRSIVMATFAVSSIIYLFAYRSMSTPMWRMVRPTANKPLIWAAIGSLAMAVLPFFVSGLRGALNIEQLTPGQWGSVLAFAAFQLVLVEIAKFIAAHRRRSLANSEAAN